MWWLVGIAFLSISVILLRVNYVVGGINKQMDEAAEKYFKQAEESKKQQ